jgi:hypothetical protein
MRETIQVSDDVQIYDTLLLIGECIKVAAGSPASITIISPWVSNVPYYLGSSGLSISIPQLAFTRSDTVKLLDVVKYATQNPMSKVIIATLIPSSGKYEYSSQQVWELRLLSELCESGASVFFYKSPGDIRKIMHAKFLMTSYGVAFGSFNYTTSGRYWHLEDGNYSSLLSPVYFEKKKRIEDIIGSCEPADTRKLKELVSRFYEK